MDWLADPSNWIAFLTLVVLELVLGVDNVIFISILAGRLPRHQQARGRRLGLALAVLSRLLVQVLLLDVFFSLDSVIPAVGMVDELAIMVTAVIVAAGLMILASGPVGDFVDRPPTIKMLALSFLLLIWFTLVVEGPPQHIPKGYIYFAMAFSVFVEMLNLRLRRGQAPGKLHEPYVGEAKT